MDARGGDHRRLSMQGSAFDLAGRTAIVTGSTRGIGLGIAQLFAESGANVVVSSEDATDVAETETVLAGQGYRVRGLACDVTDSDALAALVEGTRSAFGAIDILVCNAGITGDGDQPALDGRADRPRLAAHGRARRRQRHPDVEPVRAARQ
jgi:NAD(P)-dependent dehydrogenase (short-subunit alcohol dehydrogenase family)